MPFSDSFKKSLYRDSLAKGRNTQPVADCGNGRMLTAGDTVYYSPDGKTYGIYKVSEVDRNNVLLLGLGPAYQNTLAGVQNFFFNRKETAGGFKTGDKVKAELINEYNAIVYEDGFITGVAANALLVKTKSGLHSLSTFRCRKTD